MKVLWFSNTPANGAEYLKEGPVGGGWIKSMDRALQSKVELHIAFYYPKKDDSFKYLEATYHPISRKNWRLIALADILWQRLIDRQDLYKYLKIINSVQPDIIHIHGTENPFCCIIPNVKIPVIVTINGCLTVYDHKFLNGFTKSNLKVNFPNYGKSFRQFINYKSFIRMWKELKKMSVREQNNLQLVQYIIGHTAWDRRITSILASKSIYYHCDDMMRDVFYKRTWKYNKKRKLVIHTTTGNSPYKGFKTICETLFELNCILNFQVEWQIAGITSESSIVKITRNILKNRFPETGLLYLGELDENELINKMCQANIYVMPSHIENYVNSLCEAMLLGMPCIATFAGGTGSLLNDGEEGILIQDGDPWVLAGAILELYNNPDLASQYGIKARERALIRHNPERILKELLNIYTQVIRQSS
jgi:glycosyltransferase involved in cell wall biosynthesis